LDLRLISIARVKYPAVLKGKTKKEIKELIEDTIYNEMEKEIMIQYFVYEICQIDIAIDHNIDRKTVHNILKRGILMLS